MFQKQLLGLQFYDLVPSSTLRFYDTAILANSYLYRSDNYWSVSAF